MVNILNDDGMLITHWKSTCPEWIDSSPEELQGSTYNCNK